MKTTAEDTLVSSTSELLGEQKYTEKSHQQCLPSLGKHYTGTVGTGFLSMLQHEKQQGKCHWVRKYDLTKVYKYMLLVVADYI